jgi:hypothetical protein
MSEPYRVRALKTEYRGTVFLSRTEAARAQWLDDLGIAWDYEPQRIYLPALGVVYVPDFWLPTLRLWAEVKGVEPTGLEQAKATELAQVTGRPVAFLVGTPAENPGEDAPVVRPNGTWSTVSFSSRRVRAARYWRLTAQLALVGFLAMAILGHWHAAAVCGGVTVTAWILWRMQAGTR